MMLYHNVVVTKISVSWIWHWTPPLRDRETSTAFQNIFPVSRRIRTPPHLPCCTENISMVIRYFPKEEPVPYRVAVAEDKPYIIDDLLILGVEHVIESGPCGKL